MRTTLLLTTFLAVATLSAQEQGPVPRPPVTPEITPRSPTLSMPDLDPGTRSTVVHYHGRPIIRILQNYTLPAGETIREVQTIFGDAIINGRVEHDVNVVMGSAYIGSTAVIEGTLAVFGGSAVIEKGSSVGRDLVVVGGTLTAPAEFSPGAYQVLVGSPWFGAVLEDVAPWITRGLVWGRLIVPGIGWVWTVVGVFFLLYLALNTVFDRPVGASADALSTRPLSMFMAGLLALLLIVPAIAIVAATVIGLLLVPFLVCAVIVAALIGKAAVARAIGRSVLPAGSEEGRARATVAFVIGFGLLTLAYMVPILGFVTWALTTVLGLGAATVTFRAMLRRERPVPPPPARVERDDVAPAPAFAPPPSPSVAQAAIPVAPATPIAAEPTFSRPVLAEGLAQYPRAAFLDRVAAFALDCLLVAIAGALLDFDRYDSFDGFFLFALLGYHIAFWAWKGTTLGGIICNLRVIRTHGVELRPADAVVRGLASVFSLAALGIGCFWMLQDPERQMWHDKIAGTLVVKVPRELALV